MRNLVYNACRYDTLRRTVPNTATIAWNAGSLHAGVYFCRLSARLRDGRVVSMTRKMSVLR